MIKIINNRLIISTDIDVVAEFTLGAGIELEKKYDSVADVLKSAKKLEVCVDIAIACINSTIKKYNREYNKSLSPVSLDELEADLNLSNFENISNFRIAAINTILESKKGAKESTSENSKKKQK